MNCTKGHNVIQVKLTTLAEMSKQ